jgi:hypothetical protein
MMPKHDFAADLSLALGRSMEFERELSACFEGTDLPPQQEIGRAELCLAALLLSLEHAAVLREALAGGAPSSGAALFRLQFEALLRGAWIRFAASDVQLTKLAQPISEQSEQTAKSLPGNQDMMSSITASAPRGLVEPLAQFNDDIRHPLNSYVHAGLHPIRRRLHGFPSDLVFLMLRQSNQLLHHAYRLMALVHNSQPLMDKVTSVHVQFNDCVGYIQNTNGIGSSAA